MALEIGNKIYRTLQEQVGYNTKKIEEILALIEEMGHGGNVIEVPDMSYVLSEEELEVVNGDIAFINYNNDIYIKNNADASTAYFKALLTVAVEDTTKLAFNSKVIEVNLSSGALGITLSTLKTYTKDEIDTLIAGAGGGTKLFKHAINLGYDSTLFVEVAFTVFSTKATPYTWDTLSELGTAYFGDSSFFNTNNHLRIAMGSLSIDAGISEFCSIGFDISYVGNVFYTKDMFVWDNEGNLITTINQFEKTPADSIDTVVEL